MSPVLTFPGSLSRRYATLMLIGGLLIVGLFLGGRTAVAGGPHGSKSMPEKPNIILINMDDVDRDLPSPPGNFGSYEHFPKPARVRHRFRRLSCPVPALLVIFTVCLEPLTVTRMRPLTSNWLL